MDKPSELKLNDLRDLKGYKVITTWEIIIKASPKIWRVRIAVELTHRRQSHDRTSTHGASQQR